MQGRRTPVRCNGQRPVGLHLRTLTLHAGYTCTASKVLEAFTATVGTAGLAGL